MQSVRVFRKFFTLIAVLCIAVAAQTVVASPASAADSSIAQRYNSDSALRGQLGSPTSSEYSLANGRVRHFAWGSLYWSPSTGVHEVHGAIRWRYQNLGGPTGQLGFPTTDEGRMYGKYDVPEQLVGARNDFQNGAIEWSKDENRTVVVSKAFADQLPYYLYPWFGIPEQGDRAVKDGARLLQWPGGRMYSTKTGFYFLHAGYPSGSNGIIGKYEEKGADGGFLGLPTSDEKLVATDGVDSGRMRDFQGGRIYQCSQFLTPNCESVEAYEVHGSILWHFDHEGGGLAKLGYPISDELDAPGGKISHFQHGDIFWNSTTKATRVTFK